MSENVAETRDELLSIADGTIVSSLTVYESNLTDPASDRTAR